MRKITRKAVLGEIAAIAFSDYAKFVQVRTDENGEQFITLTDTAMLKADQKKAVASVRAGTKGIEVKLYDKLRALELLGRVCGAFESGDDGEQEALDRLKELFERSEIFGSGSVSDS